MHIHEFIQQHWKRNTVQMMAEKFGVQANWIRVNCEMLEIDPISKKDLKISFILDNRDHMSYQEMATALNCGYACIADLIRQIDTGEALQ